MPLSGRNIEIVRALVEQAPDRVVGSLQQALAQSPDDSALGGVKRLVEGEVADRNLRNSVLLPIAPMCIGSGDDTENLTFPSRVMVLLWRALKRHEIDAVDTARASLDRDADSHKAENALNTLVRAAAQGLRDRTDEDYAAVIELTDAGRPGGCDLLIACLDIAPIVRRSLPRLPEWMTHPGGETAAAARVAYKDSVAIAEDAGPIYFQMLAAHLAEPWMVMRVISAVMDRPNERYLRDSELAVFAERLLDGIDSQLAAIAALKPEAGPAAGRAAARTAGQVVHELMEIENGIDLPRDGGWGRRVHKQRAGLAAVVEARLREAEQMAMQALPMFAPRNQKVRQQQPRLDEPPEPRLVGGAMTLLSFSDELHAAANYGGFSNVRNRMVEKLGDYLDHYVDCVVDLLRTDEVEDRAIAADVLEKVAAFSLLIRGEKAAEVVRRQAHAALHT